MTLEQKLKIEPAGLSVAGASAAGGALLGRSAMLALIAMAVAMMAELVLFADTFTAMVRVWSSSQSFGHGFLVPPISAYLVWTRRHDLAGLVPRPSLAGILFVALCGFVWLAADAASVAVVQQFAVVAMLQAIVVATLGIAVAWRIALPLLFLFFAVPFGEALLPPLQDITARIIVVILGLLGIPVFLDGYYLTTATGKFHVAEACAGLRYLISSAVVGTLFAQLMYRSPWRRAVFMALALLVPIIANGLRATMIVLLAHYSGGEIATGVDHFIYGGVFLTVVTLILLGIGMLFRERRSPAPPIEQTPRPRAAPSIGVVFAVAVATLLAVSSAPAAKLWLDSDVAAAPEPRLAIPAPVRGDWQPRPTDAGGWAPRIAGADAVAARAFQRDGRRVSIHVAYFRQEKRGAEAVSSLHTLENATWRRLHETQATIIVDGTSIRALQTRLSNDRGNLFVWQWYWVDGEFVGSPYLAKALQAKARLLRRDRGTALITVATDFDSFERPPVSTLQEFLRDIGALTPALREAAGPPR